MSKSESPPKTSIFIDYSNVFVYGRQKYGITIDPLKLIPFLIKQFKIKNLIHTCYFSAEDPNNRGQKNFHMKLKKSGFIVETVDLVERAVELYCKNCKEKILPTKCPNCNVDVNLSSHKSKRIDVLIAVRLLRMCNTFDEVIFVGGDQDFVPAIEVLRKNEGKKVYVASFKKPLSNLLQSGVDGILVLDSYVNKIKL